MGQYFNLTKSRIGQIKDDTLRQMRHPVRSNLFLNNIYLLDEERKLCDRIERDRKKLAWISNINKIMDDIEFDGNIKIFDLDFSKETIASLKKIGIYTLDDLYKLNFKDAVERLGSALSDEEYARLIEDRESKNKRSLSEISIDELQLSNRSQYFLKRVGIMTLQDIFDNKDDIKKGRNIGIRAKEEVIEKFNSLVCEMGMQVDFLIE